MHRDLWQAKEGLGYVIVLQAVNSVQKPYHMMRPPYHIIIKMKNGISLVLVKLNMLQETNS